MMRVTQNTSANLVLTNLQTILQRQDQLEQQASTGLKVSYPGDDPIAAQQILQLKASTGINDQYSRNITTGTSQLSTIDSTMSTMGDALVRAKEIALSMSSDTTTADSRTAAVKELQQIRAEVISIGNTQFNGKFVFGGFKNDSPPFNTATGAFSGTTDDLNVEIAQGAYVPINFSGAKLISGGVPAGSSGVNVIGVFDNLIGALGSASASAAIAGTQAELTNLDNAAGQVNSARAEVGSRMNRLTAASTINGDMQLSLTKVMSGLQDADYTQVISDLTKQQTAFQTAIAASAKIAQISLLDYLK